jgi:hypothetical protein
MYNSNSILYNTQDADEREAADHFTVDAGKKNAPPPPHYPSQEFIYTACVSDPNPGDPVSMESLNPDPDPGEHK